jgi:hypothetical protein
MLDSNFDPLKMMYDLKEAIQRLDKNIQQVILAHQALAHRVNDQQQVLDVLISGLEASNKANEHLLKEMMSNITNKLNEVK